MSQTVTDPSSDTLLLHVEKMRLAHFPMHLPHGVRAVPSDPEEVNAFFKDNFGSIFGDRLARTATAIDRIEVNRPIIEHRKRLHSESIFFFDGDERIGWCTGEWQDSMTFYMRNTVIFPNYRGKGIYTAFLAKFLAYLADLGYERITSLHKPDNPAVLIPKIRSGFVIMSVELEERWGPLVRLVYYTQNYRREAFSEMVR